MNMKLIIGCLFIAAPLQAMEKNKVQVWDKITSIDQNVRDAVTIHGFDTYYTKKEYETNPIIRMCQELDNMHTTHQTLLAMLWGNEAFNIIKKADAAIEKNIGSEELLKILQATQDLSIIRNEDNSAESEAKWQPFRDLYWQNATIYLEKISQLKLANVNNPEQFLNDNRQGIDVFKTMPTFYAALYLYHHAKINYTQNPCHFKFFQFDEATQKDLDAQQKN